MNNLRMQGEPGFYRLSEEENTHIFQRRIVPELLADVPSQAEPILTVLVAQHGAGKTHLAEHNIKPGLQERGGFIDIDSDLYKKYHPAYDELMAQNDQTMALHTAADGQRWMLQALRYARDRRQHTLAQETVQNPPFLVDMIETYRAMDFQVDITAMGVAEAVSRQGLIKRYHDQVRTSGAGRLPTPEKVQASLRGILEFADNVDERKLADEVSVFRRGSLQPTYSNTVNDGEWRLAPGFRSAIESERTRPLNLQEATDFQSTHEHLTRELGSEWEFEIHAIQRLAHPLLHGSVEHVDDDLTA